MTREVSLKSASFDRAGGEYSTTVKWYVSVSRTDSSILVRVVAVCSINNFTRRRRARVQFNYTRRVSLVDHGIISAGCKCVTINYTTAETAAIYY